MNMDLLNEPINFGQEDSVTEEYIKTQLIDLVKENRLLITRVKRLVNLCLIIAGIVFIPFFYSFVDVQTRLTKIESNITNNIFTKDQIYESFPTKWKVIYLQNDIYDLVNHQFKKNDLVTEQQFEIDYQKALKEFNGDVSRGVESTN